MSKESREWLSTNTLIGFTEKRGNAWHYREGDNNHYRGAVPVTDVEKRLFDWTAEERPVYVDGSGHDLIVVPDRKAIVRSDNDHVMGIFKDGYQPHQYRQWLLEEVANILDDGLSIGSAGLLRGGAVAWVSVEVPENIETPEGVVFRPSLMARTSFDGTIATTFGRHITNVVCDNTMAVAAEQHGGQQVRVRHSSKSLTRLSDVREALGIVYSIADDFAAQVAALSSVQVTDKSFERLLDDLNPLPDPDRKAAYTRAEKRRDSLWHLWTSDTRVAPWHGTGFGAWQAFNTYGQHEGEVRGMGRVERNMLNAVNGTIESADVDTVKRILALAV